MFKVSNLFKANLRNIFVVENILKMSSSIYTPKYLETKLTEKLSAQYVHAVDESDGCGGKFSVIVVSEAFRGKTLLQKHRLVNAALADELKEIHAFSQKSYTPEEWAKELEEDKEQ